MLQTARGTDKDTALLIGGNATIFDNVPRGSGAKLHLNPGECAMVVNNGDEDLAIYAAIGEFSDDLLGNPVKKKSLTLPSGQAMLFARYAVKDKDFVFCTQPLEDLID